MESTKHAEDQEEEPEEPREYNSPACYLHEFERSANEDAKQAHNTGTCTKHDPVGKEG